MTDSDNKQIDKIGKAAERIAQVETWFEEAKKAAAGRNERWRKNEDLYYNRVELDVSRFDTKLKFPIPLSVIETEMPIISDYLPTFDVVPQQQNDIEYADLMQMRKGQVETQTKLKKKSLLATKDSLIYSNGILEVIPEFDEESKRFRGIKISSVDPFTCYPSPDATGLDIRSEARYVIFATPMHVDDIKREYSIEAKGEGNLDEYRSFQVSEGNTEGKDPNEALFKECFSRDDPKKYPNGRFTAWVGNNLVVDIPLFKIGDDVEKYEEARIPYFMVANYKSPHSFLGIGETELVKSSVKALNETMSSIADNIERTGSPIKKVTKSFWVEFKQKFSGKAGEEIKVNKPDDVTYLMPPSVPAYTFTFVDMLLKMIDVSTGVHDVIEGKRPTGITAASAIIALQEAAQARIRYKIVNEITPFVEEIGRFIIWLLQTYDEEVVSIRKRNTTGEYEFTKYDPSSLRDTKFDIEIVGGTRTPTGRAYLEERAFKLYGLGAYGIEELVNALNEPNKKEVIENWYKRQAMMQGQGDLQGGGQYPEELLELLRAASEMNPEELKDSEIEDKILEYLEQFPDAVDSEEFQMLPEEIQERLVSVLEVEGEQLNE